MTVDSPSGGSSFSAVQERLLRTPDGDLFIRDQAGEEPPIVLVHGFPDDHHIYDRLAPLLSPRRVVSFDWLGYGRSGRRDPAHGFAPGDRNRELTSLVDTLGIDTFVLVGHDAGMPEALDWALDHPQRVRGLVLLNGYYGLSTGALLPEMIQLLSDPLLVPLADALLADPGQIIWLLTHTGRRFGSVNPATDGVVTTSVLPQWFGDATQGDSLAEIRAWTADLPRARAEQERRIANGDLARLGVPTALVFGGDDSYLSPASAGTLANHLGHARAITVSDASHWVQWDRPEIVANEILAIATAPPEQAHG